MKKDEVSCASFENLDVNWTNRKFNGIIFAQNDSTNFRTLIGLKKKFVKQFWKPPESYLNKKLKKLCEISKGNVDISFERLRTYH
jgi:hypothetical protein